MLQIQEKLESYTLFLKGGQVNFCLFCFVCFSILSMVLGEMDT